MAAKTSDDKISFEKALEKLEKIVTSMEDSQLSLDDMMKHFEEGKKLSDYCGRKLNEFEKKIEILVKANSEGGEWKNFQKGENDSFELSNH